MVLLNAVKGLNWSKLQRWRLPIILFLLTVLLLGAVAGYRVLRERVYLKGILYSLIVKPPSQVHWAWDQDPATTLNLRWHTRRLDTPSVVEYRLPGEETWHIDVGEQRPAPTGGALHEAELQNLTPATAYEYRLKGDYLQGFWGDVHRFTTAPAPGEGEFEAIYFADTGLKGRRDGLDTGVQQIIDAIAAEQPLLTLAGGDYAYYNTDKRYGSLEASIDVWFNQMAPVFETAAVMPTYGNHETQLRENLTPWMDRFATPTSTPDRRNYSFDVGPAHFVSIFAVFEEQGLEPEALTWIRQDIEAAQAAGQQWIVPFMHVSAFAEGTSHPSNLALRSQLGPLFEDLGVKLVLSSHDQAFERTYPLVDVPAQNRPTTTATDCYTLDQGTTWLKTSPSGKKSSQGNDFSMFTAPPSPWVAKRDNTRHVYTRLHITADELAVTTLGVSTDGQPPLELDHFVYTQNQCPAA